MILPARAACLAAARLVAAALLAWTATADAALHAQLQVAAVRGVVSDSKHQPLGGAVVSLLDLDGTAVRSAAAAPDGSFHIPDVAPGSYLVRVVVQDATVLTEPIVVRGSLPIHLELKAELAMRDEVVVRGDAAPETPERPWTLAGETVRTRPGALPSQRVPASLGALPGWTSEDNGLLHVRGSDDALLYVQDGIPVYERVDRLFGVAPNPSGIASLHVLNGYIPAEFGWKNGAVVEVRSESGVGADWRGTLDAGAGTYATADVGALAAGSIGADSGLMLTASSERSARFLDPVDPANHHNDGRAATAGAQWTWRPQARVLSASVQGGESQYDVPHNTEQERAGQDQRQRVSQWLTSASWQQVLTERTVLQLSGYARWNAATIDGSTHDTPVTLDGDRRGRRHGALWSVAHQRGRHTFKAGGELSSLRLEERFAFAVTDPDASEEADLSPAALVHDALNPFRFGGSARPLLWSGFVQDIFHASGRVTLNAGVRFDSSRMLIRTSQWSPRVGAAVRMANGTVARASIMRLFQPPQAEYLLLASSPEARLLSPFVDDEAGGGSAIPPDRQTAFDADISHDLGGRWRLQAAAWRRHGRHVGDPNVFFGTTVTVPNSVARHRAWGYEARLDMRPRRGWSGSATYTHARVEQYGPITGGLFLEDEYLEIRDGTRFIPDHDQRHAATVSASYADAVRRWRVSGAFRYATGTPVGVDEDDLDELAERPGSEVVDFQSGRVRPRGLVDIEGAWRFRRTRSATWTLTGWVANLTNRAYAFNFGNPFSGTHFGSRRRAGMGVAISFGRPDAKGG